MKKMIKASDNHLTIWQEEYKPVVDTLENEDFYYFVGDHLWPAMEEILDSDEMYDKLVEVYKDPATKDYQSFKANLKKALLG